MIIHAESLKKLVIAILKNGGSNNKEAQTVVEHIVSSNLDGSDSHGVGILPTQLRMLQADLLKPNQDPERISLNERLAKGIPLDDASWEQILAVGEALGLTHKTMHNLV